MDIKQLSISYMAIEKIDGKNWQRIEMKDADDNKYVTFRDFDAKKILLAQAEFFRQVALSTDNLGSQALTMLASDQFATIADLL